MRSPSLGSRTVLAFALGLVPLLVAPEGLADTPSKPPELRQLLERRAAIALPGVGIHRLVLPPDVLARSRADLADLRIIDDQGHSLPFETLLPGEAAPPSSVTVPRLTAIDRSYDDEGRPTGERLVFVPPGGPVPFDAIEIPLPPGRDFVGHVDVRVETADGTLRTLADGAPLFRLPAWGPTATRQTRIELPRTTARRIMLDVRIQEGAWIAPSRLTLITRLDREAPTGRLRLEAIERTTSARGTRLRLAIPRGVQIRRLHLDTEAGSFLRPIRVVDESGAELATGAVARLVDPDGTKRERLSLALLRTPFREMTIEIEDAGERPLPGLRVEGEVALPTLVFMAPAASSPRLYWKSERLHYPSHRELHALAEIAGDLDRTSLPEESARWAWVTGLPLARLGPEEANPRYRATTPLFGGVRPGAVVDPGAWSHRRTIELAPSDAGLSSWTLDPTSLALLRGDLGDLRVIDGQRRQLPFVLAATPEHGIPVASQPRSLRPGVTSIELLLPVQPVHVRAFELEFQERFFDRPMRAFGLVEGEKEERRLLSWQAVGRGDRTRRPRQHSGAIGTRVQSLRIEIDDGDSAPLTLQRAELFTVTKRVVVAGAAGTHELLLGNPAATAPRYDLTTARELLAALPAGEAIVGPLGANPEHLAAGPLDGLDLGTLGVWGAIAAAILALVILSLQLARIPEEADGDGKD